MGIPKRKEKITKTQIATMRFIDLNFMKCPGLKYFPNFLSFILLLKKRFNGSLNLLFFLFFLGHVVDSEQCKEIEERENKDVVVQDDREDPSEAKCKEQGNDARNGGSVEIFFEALQASGFSKEKPEEKHH